MFSGCSAKTLTTSEPNYWKKQRPRSTMRQQDSGNSHNAYKLENAVLKLEVQQLKYDLESLKSLFTQLVSKTRKLLMPDSPSWLSSAKAYTAECSTYLSQLETHFSKRASDHQQNSQRFKEKLGEIMELYCAELEQENAKLRDMLGISRDVDRDMEQRIKQLELEYVGTQESVEQEGVKNILEKAVGDAKKRKEKKETEVQQRVENVNDPSSHLLPNKEAAHKNMKPKTAYLLGSPDVSDEEDEEDEEVDVVKNVQSKYLL